MSYELSGKLCFKGETVQRSATFKVREFAVEKSEDANGRTFTNYIKFQCVQDKTSLLDSIRIGDEIKVFFNIKGNKSERDGRVSYFTNLDAWRIEAGSREGTDAPHTDQDYMEPLDTFSATAPDAIDDLPF